MTSRTRFRWFPVASLALLVPVFVSLGIWQLQRADYKRGLQRDYDDNATQAPTFLGSALWPVAQARFQRVAVRGVYDPGYQILLDNRILHGQPGYEVLTPLRIQGGDTRVLINRGWVPLGGSRAILPPTDAPEGVQTVVGITLLPPKNFFSLDHADAAPRPGWEPVWQHLDMKRYAARVPFDVQPMIVRLDPAAPGGFAREWPRVDAGVSVHQAYAVQWFAFALLTLATLVVMLRRSLRAASKGRNIKRR